MKNYSRDKQDLFILAIFSENFIGNFVDIGCYLPNTGNNTYLLEKFGWNGIGIDIRDFEIQWRVRKAKFIQKDAMICDYKELFENNNLPKIIDYLSLDVDGDGDRFTALNKVFDSGYEFKVITLEHDAYAGHEKTEREKQREFLIERDYKLIASNVMCESGPFEDWWINPKYVDIQDLSIIESKFPDEIIKLIENKIVLK